MLSSHAKDHIPERSPRLIKYTPMTYLSSSEPLIQCSPDMGKNRAGTLQESATSVSHLLAVSTGPESWDLQAEWRKEQLELVLKDICKPHLGAQQLKAIVRDLLNGWLTKEHAAKLLNNHAGQYFPCK